MSPEGPNPPAPPKPAQRDAWDRALSSLESEFETSLKREETPRPPSSEGGPGSSAPSGSGAKALLATQDLSAEVDRLREELESREEALEMFEQLQKEGRLDPDLVAPAFRREDRSKLAELESSLARAQKESTERKDAVESLRTQLEAAQGQLRAALGAVASSIPGLPGSEEAPAVPSHLAQALSEASASVTPMETAWEGRRVIRRSAHSGSSGTSRAMLAPVEVYGPNEELLGSVVFALGEGEALELFLSTLFHQWKGLGGSFEARLSPDGIHVNLSGDTENRRISILTSGAYVIHLGSSEASRIRALLGPTGSGGARSS